MKTVLFTLNASYIHKSPALRYLGNALKRSGFEIATVEFSVKERRLRVLERLMEEQGEIYCFSCYIWNIEQMLQTAEKLKKLRPDVTVIFGGPEVSYEEETYPESHPYIDFIVAGEGEESLPALCLKIREKGREAALREGRFIRSLPYAGFAEEGIPYAPSDLTSSSVIYYESARGCPYSCSYCLSAAEKGIRSKTAERVLDELLQFERGQGVRVIKFLDRTFNFDRKRARQILSGLLSEAYTGHYHFEICAELLEEEDFAILDRFPAGKIQFEAGVQSTNPATLAAIGRSGDVKRCIENIGRVRKAGNIHVHADLIAGLPLEDLQSFSRSFDEVYRCCDMLQLGFLKLLKGTPLSREAERYGIVCSGTPPYEVLKTDVLSFEDLLLLHRVSDLLDRVSNSGRFTYTLRGVIGKVESPFAFFSALAEQIGPLDSLSQLKLFSLLHEKLLDQALLPPEELTGRMRLDYYIAETGSCPAFLSGGGELTVPPVLRSLAIGKADGRVIPSAAEVHRFSFDPRSYYLVDRKQHFCLRMTEEELIGKG